MTPTPDAPRLLHLAPNIPGDAEGGGQSPQPGAGAARAPGRPAEGGAKSLQVAQAPSNSSTQAGTTSLAGP